MNERINLTPGIVHFCARECELQMSGERSVGWMVDAWMYAWTLESDRLRPNMVDVCSLGYHVEPVKNVKGFRQVGVRVGWDVKMDWSLVPRQMELLMEEGQYSLTPAEFYRQYEEIHPFVDGNGRTGVILYNWLNHTLNDPIWPPNFWGDPRRLSGSGAPETCKVVGCNKILDHADACGPEE